MLSKNENQNKSLNWTCRHCLVAAGVRSSHDQTAVS